MILSSPQYNINERVTTTYGNGWIRSFDPVADLYRIGEKALPGLLQCYSILTRRFARRRARLEGARRADQGVLDEGQGRRCERRVWDPRRQRRQERARQQPRDGFRIEEGGQQQGGQQGESTPSAYKGMEMEGRLNPNWTSNSSLRSSRRRTTARRRR